MLPGQVRATVQVRQYSNLLFNSRYQNSFNRITSRTQRWSGSLDRDLRLATIWTGSNEVMRAVISHEYYRELLGAEHTGRDVERDTTGFEYDVEKVYE